MHFRFKTWNCESYVKVFPFSIRFLSTVLTKGNLKNCWPQTTKNRPQFVFRCPVHKSDPMWDVLKIVTHNYSISDCFKTGRRRRFDSLPNEINCWLRNNNLTQNRGTDHGTTPKNITHSITFCWNNRIERNFFLRASNCFVFFVRFLETPMICDDLP